MKESVDLPGELHDEPSYRCSVVFVTEATTLGELEVLKSLYGVTAMTHYRRDGKVHTLLNCHAGGGFSGCGETLAEATNKGFQMVAENDPSARK